MSNLSNAEILGGGVVVVGADLAGLRAGEAEARQIAERISRIRATVSTITAVNPSSGGGGGFVALGGPSPTAIMPREQMALQSMIASQNRLAVSMDRLVTAVESSRNQVTASAGGGGSGGGGGGGGAGLGRRNLFSTRGVSAALGVGLTGVFAAMEVLKVSSAFAEAADVRAHPERQIRAMSEGVAHVPDSYLVAVAKATDELQAQASNLKAVESIPLAGTLLRFVDSMAGTTASMEEVGKITAALGESHKRAIAEQDSATVKMAGLTGGPVAELKASQSLKIESLRLASKQAGDDQMAVYNEKEVQARKHAMWQAVLPHNLILAAHQAIVQAKMPTAESLLNYTPGQKPSIDTAAQDKALADYKAASDLEIRQAEARKAAVPWSMQIRAEAGAAANQATAIRASEQLAAANKVDPKARLDMRVAAAVAENVSREKEIRAAYVQEVAGKNPEDARAVRGKAMQELDRLQGEYAAKLTGFEAERVTIGVEASRKITAIESEGYAAQLRMTRDFYGAEKALRESSFQASLKQEADPKVRQAMAESHKLTEEAADREQKQKEIDEKNEYEYRIQAARLHAQNMAVTASVYSAAHRLKTEVMAAEPKAQADANRAASEEIKAKLHEITAVQGGGEAAVVQADLGGRGIAGIGDYMDWSGRAKDRKAAIAQAKGAIADFDRQAIVSELWKASQPNRPSIFQASANATPEQQLQAQNKMVELLTTLVQKISPFALAG